MPSWRLKAALQRAFSAVPAGHRANYLFQRHVTHGVPVSDAKLASSVAMARDHLDRLAAHASTPAAEGHFYEFGAGWDLRLPQVLWCLGVERQTVIDIRPLARPALVADVARRLAAGGDALGLARVPPVPGDITSLGIDYRAPSDARATGLPDGSVDRITSTNTLEHIPPEDIAAILRECHRILADDGLVSFKIDYQDHYASFDPGISIYNFLQYDERAWRRYNPDLHFQNRLRHADHLRLVEEAGFEVLDEVVATGDAEARQALERLALAGPFRDRALDDLAIFEGRLVLRKR